MDNAITIKEKAFVVPSVEDTKQCKSAVHLSWRTSWELLSSTDGTTKALSFTVGKHENWDLGILFCPVVDDSSCCSANTLPPAWYMWCDQTLRIVREYQSMSSKHLFYLGSESYEVTSLAGLIRGLLNDVSFIKGHRAIWLQEWEPFHQTRETKKVSNHITSITTGLAVSWAPSHAIFTRQQICRGRQTTCWGLCVQHNHLTKKTEVRGGQKGIIKNSKNHIKIYKNVRIIYSNYHANKYLAIT